MVKKAITVAEFISFINALKGCKFATICYTTTCRFPKKSGLQDVEKCVTIEGAQINYDYQNAVNNRLKKAGLPATFVSQAPRGKVWETHNKISISTDGKETRYLRFYLQKNANISVVYIEHGKPCDPARVAQIKAYVSSQAKPTIGTQSAVGLTDNQVEPRDITLTNIHYLIVDGQRLTMSEPSVNVAC